MSDNHSISAKVQSKSVMDSSWQNSKLKIKIKFTKSISKLIHSNSNSISLDTNLLYSNVSVRKGGKTRKLKRQPLGYSTSHRNRSNRHRRLFCHCWMGRSYQNMADLKRIHQHLSCKIGTQAVLWTRRTSPQFSNHQKLIHLRRLRKWGNKGMELRW